MSRIRDKDVQIVSTIFAGTIEFLFCTSVTWSCRTKILFTTNVTQLTTLTIHPHINSSVEEEPNTNTIQPHNPYFYTDKIMNHTPISTLVSAQVAAELTTMTSQQNSQQRLYEDRLSLSVCLSLGDKFLSKNQFEQANDAFDSAHRFLTTTPSVGQQSVKVDDCVSSLSSLSSAATPLTHIDTYHEDECDVGPRIFNACIIPEDAMSLDVDVLQLIIAYNQALVYHSCDNYALASQLYKFITGTIGTYMNSGNVNSTLMHLAMRAHNNLGQIEYTERSEEYAQTEFENALMYVRNHYNKSPCATTTTSTIPINNATTPAEQQLEIATVLSNWCRARWMMGNVDHTLDNALHDVLQIRTANLELEHADLAVAHFNLGRLEYSRRSNDKALKHFLHYMRIASAQDTIGETQFENKNNNSKIELDPIQGLTYVLQIQNEGNDDEVSTDLVWGLRTLQEKREDLGLIHSDVASVLNYIGTLLFRRRELNYALCFFAQELRVEEELKAQTGTRKCADVDEDVSISVTCNNIGRILQELGRYEDAKYYYQRSLGEDKSVLTGKTCSSLKQKYMCEKRASDEDMVCEHNLDDFEKIPAAAMNLYSTVWYNLGLIHDKMGAFKEAIRSFRMSLKLRRAMLGHEHSDVSCLYYNIGVLQMEQKLLDDATDSFRQALAYRHVSGKGQLNDLHVIKTLQKLSKMHKSNGNVKGALNAYSDILSVLSTSNDLDERERSTKTAIAKRDIADLHQAQGDLQSALMQAMSSVELFRSLRTSSEDAMDTEEGSRSYVEEEASALHLVGSLQHELSEPLEAQKAFSESARLVHSALSKNLTNSGDATKLAASLVPTLEVSTFLAASSCAAMA